ncbi:ABC transporter permease [Microbispora sp. H10885]|uniref:ABC transporter permease n=1 Tax=Microbispora sp. H10885 TaxID=2729110 RepID=UPI001601FF89|nr:ABC transporter permease [Microbispora sp. H10885]
MTTRTRRPEGPHATAAEDGTTTEDLPIPFRRLLRAETRKLAGTRSGKVIAVLLVALVVASVAARATVAGPEPQRLIFTAGIALGTLLPVLGILTMTGEWTHRTALTTFALEPRRHRVIAAKCVPPLAATVLLSLLAMLVAVPVTAVAAGVRNTPPVWDVDPAALLGWTGANVLVTATGLALGALLLNAPSAIVICLTAPMLWSAAARLGPGGAALAGWLDLGTTSAPLMTGDLTWSDGARLAASATLWIVVPMTAGLIRVLRKEVI